MRRPPPLPSILLLALGSCSGTQDPRPPAPTPCPTAPVATATLPSAPAPARLASAEGAVSVLTSRDDVPLTGPRVDGKAGDLMVANGQAAVVVTQEGRIADFGAKGTRDELVWLAPTISVGMNGVDTPVSKVVAEAGNKAIRIEKAVGGRPIVLVTWVWLSGGLLRVDTVAQGTSDDPALAVTLGERVHWGNVPTWLDGRGYVKDSNKQLGQFLARDSLGIAYALCSEDGPLFAKIDEQEFSGLFEAARTGESVVLVPAHGVSAGRSIVLTASTRSLGEAVMALPCGLGRASGPAAGNAAGAANATGAGNVAGAGNVTGAGNVAGVANAIGAGNAAGASNAVGASNAIGAARQKLIIASIAVPRARLEVTRCAADGTVGKPFVEYRGEADGIGLKASTRIGAIELPQGCFKARLTAPGHTSGPWVEPDKLVGAVPTGLLPQAGTLTFSVTEAGQPLPARLVVRGEDGTRDPDWGDDAESTGAASNVLTTTGAGEVALPAGKYRVWINRGFEYSGREERITVAVGKTTTLKAALDRVVDTKGWIAADLHLHAVPSSDAPSLLSDRLRSLVAAGIEVGVATDHNAVTDYRPTIAELGQQSRIASVIGDEITTRDVPFGHFNAFPLEAGAAPIPYKDTLPSAIFSAVRASRPYGKDTIVQVNHPRMGGIGYFELLRFDPVDLPGWLARAPLADMSFDALEVFNGDHYARISKVLEVMSDWYALLNAGYRPTATGNSDSHRVSFHEPGTPRNLVHIPDDDPAKFDERTFIEAVRAGRVVVSSGPFVTLSIGDKGVGDTIPAGDSEIVVHVDGPEWVDIDEVTLVKRGEVLKTWKLADKPDTPKKAANPPNGAKSPPHPGKRPWRLTHKEPLKPGDWVIAIARGSKPMSYLYRQSATPFAFTNPVFVK